MPKHRLFLLPILLFLTGCASTRAAHPEVPRDQITRDMLEEAESLTAFEAIRRYRPIWLRSTRGQDSFMAQGRRGVRVYIDDVAVGGVNALKELNANVVDEIRFLDKREATTRFGTDHAEGAILVRTRSSQG